MEHVAHAPATPLLTALILVPFAGAALLALLPRRRPGIPKMIAVLVSELTAALSVAVLVQFDQHEAGFQLQNHHSWIASFGISWTIGVDGISLFLVVLTAILFPIAILGTDPHHDHKAFYAWLLLLEAGCLGVFLALDLFLFFVFFEIVLVPMYFLIGQWGHGNRTYAALKFFLYTMFGSALMLVALIATAVLNQKAVGGPLTFDLVAIASNNGIDKNTAHWLFLGFAVAFAVKVPLFPVHTWLPDAHTEAPTAGSVILAGVMLKLGTYGLIRYGLYLFPEATVYFAPAMVTLGVIGITYGAIVATMPDLQWREKLVLAPLVLLIVGMGVYPKPVLDRINPSVNELVHHVQAASK
jgi:NADH-quinone oxidoreductase subunit M